MVKNLPANAGDIGLIPGPGRSHKQLICHTTTSGPHSLEPTLCNKRSPHTTTREWPRSLPTRESPHAAMKTQRRKKGRGRGRLDRRGGHVETHREKGMWRPSQRLEWCSYSPGMPRITGIGIQVRGMKPSLPQSFQKEWALSIPWFQTFGLHICDRIYVCCFNHLVWGNLLWQPQETNTAGKRGKEAGWGFQESLEMSLIFV